MFAAIREQIATLATTATDAGGMGFANARGTLYDELPDDLPALCLGPLALDGVQAKGAAASGVFGNVAVGVLLATDFSDGAAAADTATARLLASLSAQGYTVARLSQVEDDWAGRHVFTTSAELRVGRVISF